MLIVITLVTSAKNLWYVTLLCIQFVFLENKNNCKLYFRIKPILITLNAFTFLFGCNASNLYIICIYNLTVPISLLELYM